MEAFSKILRVGLKEPGGTSRLPEIRERMTISGEQKSGENAKSEEKRHPQIEACIRKPAKGCLQKEACYFCEDIIPQRRNSGSWLFTASWTMRL